MNKYIIYLWTPPMTLVYRAVRSGSAAQKAEQGVSIYYKSPPAFCVSLNPVVLLTLYLSNN